MIFSLLKCWSRWSDSEYQLSRILWFAVQVQRVYAARLGFELKTISLFSSPRTTHNFLALWLQLSVSSSIPNALIHLWVPSIISSDAFYRIDLALDSLSQLPIPASLKAPSPRTFHPYVSLMFVSVMIFKGESVWSLWRWSAVPAFFKLPNNPLDHRTITWANLCPCPLSSCYYVIESPVGALEHLCWGHADLIKGLGSIWRQRWL